MLDTQMNAFSVVNTELYIS